MTDNEADTNFRSSSNINAPRDCRERHDGSYCHGIAVERRRSTVRQPDHTGDGFGEPHRQQRYNRHLRIIDFFSCLLHPKKIV